MKKYLVTQKNAVKNNRFNIKQQDKQKTKMPIHRTSAPLPNIGFASCNFVNRPNDNGLFHAILECVELNWDALDKYLNVASGAMRDIELQSENMCHAVFEHNFEYNNDQLMRNFLCCMLVLIIARRWLSSLSWRAKNDQASIMYSLMRIFLRYYIASLHCLISITLYTALHVLIQKCCENYFLLHSICVFTMIVHVLSSESILKNGAIYQVFCHITQLFKLNFLQHYLPQTCTSIYLAYDEFFDTIFWAYTKFVGISWQLFYDVELQSFLTSAYNCFCEYVYDTNSLLAFWKAFCTFLHKQITSISVVPTDDRKLWIILLMIIFCQSVRTFKKAGYQWYILWKMKSAMQQWSKQLNLLKA